MRRYLWLGIAGAMLLAAAAALAQPGAESVWMADKAASSDALLNPSQCTRILDMQTTQLYGRVLRVLSANMDMSLSPFPPGNKMVRALTTQRTGMPAEIAGSEDQTLVGENFQFELTVEMKRRKDKNVVKVRAYPVYRTQAGAGNADCGTVELKVKGEPGNIVSMGPVFIVPMTGQLKAGPRNTLPDAPERAAKLVRTFMYYLDQEVTAPDGRDGARTSAKGTGMTDEKECGSRKTGICESYRKSGM